MSRRDAGRPANHDRNTKIDVSKVDIEGLELELLTSLQASILSCVDQLTVEFHEPVGLGTAKQVQRTIDYLRGYGFEAVRGSFFDYSDVLFLHEERLHLPSHWRWVCQTRTDLQWSFPQARQNFPQAKQRLTRFAGSSPLVVQAGFLGHFGTVQRNHFHHDYV
jgi:hypothetical protein